MEKLYLHSIPVRSVVCHYVAILILVTSLAGYSLGQDKSALNPASYYTAAHSSGVGYTSLYISASFFYQSVR